MIAEILGIGAQAVGLDNGTIVDCACVVVWLLATFYIIGCEGEGEKEEALIFVLGKLFL